MMKAFRLASSIGSFGSVGRRTQLFTSRVRLFSSSTRSSVRPKLGSFIPLVGLSLGVAFFVSRDTKADDNVEVAITSVTEEAKKETAKPYVEEEKHVAFKYVIIGGGTAAHSALIAILKNDPEAKVLVVSAEAHFPYMRPPLTKDLWNSEDPKVAVNLKFKNWEGVESSVWFEGVDYKDDPRITFISNQRVIDLDPYRKAVLLEDMSIVDYEQCLIATGGDPRLLPSAKGVEHVSTYRTLDDFRQIDQVSRHAKHIVIIGGGFLGSELAWGVSKKGVKVTQVFPESGVLAATFPQYLSDYATDVGRKAGIDIIPGVLVNSMTQEGDKVKVTLDNGKTLDAADHVVVAAGIIPSKQLAESADLEIDPSNGGIVVNPELEVRSGLYAAGDVASYYDVVQGIRRRVEHHDHATASGKIAGENMTGARKPYAYQPFFWSDVGPIGFEAVGVIDSRLKTVAIWQKPEEETTKEEYKRGIVYYLKDDVVVGVVLLGVYGKVDGARSLIKRKKKVSNPEDFKHFISLEEEHH